MTTQVCASLLTVLTAAHGEPPGRWGGEGGTFGRGCSSSEKSQKDPERVWAQSRKRGTDWGASWAPPLKSQVCLWDGCPSESGNNKHLAPSELCLEDTQMQQEGNLVPQKMFRGQGLNPRSILKSLAMWPNLGHGLGPCDSTQEEGSEPVPRTGHGPRSPRRAEERRCVSVGTRLSLPT